MVSIERIGAGARVAAQLLLAAIARHWAFVLVAAVGVGLRVVAVIAYTPSLPFRNYDAFMYVDRSVRFSAEGSFHPFLYSATLKPFLLANAFPWLVAVQHAAGAVVGFLLYIVLRRFGLPGWVAALGAAPVFLDGYQIALEHQVFAETFFELFAVAGVVALVWNVAPRWPAAALAGVLLGISVLFRFPGLAVIAAAIAYALVRRVGWRPFAALVLSAAVPLLAYSTWFESQTGTFGLTNRNGFYLYGRVAAFADCERVPVPAEERIFCPESLEHPPGHGLFDSGLRPEIRGDPRYNELASSFARRMIRAHPDDFASAVAADFAKYFRSRASQDHAKWLFPRALTRLDDSRVPRGISIDFRMHDSSASLLRSWQTTVSLYGPLLAVLLALGLAGGIAGWTAKGRPPLGPEALVLSLAVLGLMIFPTIFAVYHFRYTIPAIPFAGAAGALGAWAIWERFRMRRWTAAMASRSRPRARAET